MLTTHPDVVPRRSRDGGIAGKLKSREGFSLAELLVGISLAVILSAVTLPAVVTQIKGADVAALEGELNGMADAILAFYSDIARYPSEVNQLVFNPDGVGNDSDTDAIEVDDLGFWQDNSGAKKPFPGGRIKRWAGPYLQLGYVPPSGGITTNLDGKILRNFLMVCTGGKRYLAIEVADISLEDALAVSVFSEGENVLGPVAIWNDGTDDFVDRGPTGTETNAGLIRWYDPSQSGTAIPADGDVGNLVYLVVAVGSPGC